MEIKQLERGKELVKNIGQLEDGLKDLREWQTEINSQITTPDEDGMYSLCLAEYRDGSGHSMKLLRSHGNVEILEAVIYTMEKQLKEARKEFEEL